MGDRCVTFFFFQAEDGIRDLVRSRGLGDVYKRQVSRITEAFRVEYYKLVKRILDEQDQVIGCYAGWALSLIHI